VTACCARRAPLRSNAWLPSTTCESRINSIVWFTRSEFTLDFAIRPPSDDTRDVGRLVSRVRYPTLFVFDLIRRLNAAMTNYEHKVGEIPRYDDNR
jgi:hypothetical protein